MPVYVLDRGGQPLMPCSEKRARKLLAGKRARVHRLQPVVIRRICCDAEDRLARGYPMRSKRVHGFGTGDMVRAEVPEGAKAGIYRGRAAMRATGRFNIQRRHDGASVVIQSISHRHCRLMQRADGYGYFLERATDQGREQARHKASDAAHPMLGLPGRNAGVSRAI